MEGVRRGKPAATRTKANHEAIARRHGAQRARAPALDLEAVHDASRKEAAMELRLVTQSNASCRRAKQFSFPESAPGFSPPRNPPPSSPPNVPSSLRTNN